MSALTHERLLELLHYDPETGHFTWRVDRGNVVRAGDRAGHVSKVDGYRRIKIGRVLHPVQRLAVFYMTGAWPPDDVDHRFGDRDDNRWSELRPLTRTGNMQNLQQAHRDNKCGLLGVAPTRGRFAAYIRHSGKNHYLGTFDTAEQAHAAYIDEKRRVHPGWQPPARKAKQQVQQPEEATA